MREKIKSQESPLKDNCKLEWMDDDNNFLLDDKLEDLEMVKINKVMDLTDKAMLKYRPPLGKCK